MAKAKKKKYDHAGQPTVMTPEIQNKICDRLSLGESLIRICKDGDMPNVTTVYRFLLQPENDEFCNMYAQARENQADTFMDQCVDIADDTANDTMILINKDGEEYEKVNHDYINRSRLKVDTRIRVSEKMAPRKYMPQNKTKHTGPGGGAIEILTSIPEPNTKES